VYVANARELAAIIGWEHLCSTHPKFAAALAGEADKWKDDLHGEPIEPCRYCGKPGERLRNLCTKEAEEDASSTSATHASSPL
jgi:hypothetical protein